MKHRALGKMNKIIHWPHLQKYQYFNSYSIRLKRRYRPVDHPYYLKTIVLYLSVKDRKAYPFTYFSGHHSKKVFYIILQRIKIYICFVLSQRDSSDPEEAFKSWLQRKREQQQKERQLLELKKMGEDSSYLLHSRQECEHAFKLWASLVFI